MKRRAETIIFLIITVLSVVAMHFYVVLFTPVSRSGETIIINVARGASISSISANLEKTGLIRSAFSFKLMASVVSRYRKVQAGEYEFDGTMSSVDIIDAFVKGRVKRYMVTIPEGYNIRDIAAALSEAGLAGADDFILRANDERFALNLGVDGPTLEGYLFPDTYEFTKSMSVDDIITRMVGRFKAVYNAEFAHLAAVKKLSMKKVVTMASIVEKETAVADERALVASVFYNRLRKGIKLQSDPTVTYEVKDFDGKITKKMLLADNRYNTYAIYGLPPGPIANPGRASLKAAVVWPDEDYIFFVSRNDGTHFFSTTLGEHNKAVNQFQRRSKKSKRPAA